MAKKDEKPDTIKQLFECVGNYRYLTIASWQSTRMHWKKCRARRLSM